MDGAEVLSGPTLSGSGAHCTTICALTNGCAAVHLRSHYGPYENITCPQGNDVNTSCVTSQKYYICELLKPQTMIGKYSLVGDSVVTTIGMLETKITCYSNC